jgi:oligopeptide/dipeptide ABC transporter ATP-binding protein
MRDRSVEPLLTLEHLQVDLKVRGGMRRILQDVSQTVAAGESLGLVGESGSGKTMTVRTILRLLPFGARVEGDVVFDGLPVYKLNRASLRHFRGSDVAMIYQDPQVSINPLRTVGDFLTEGLTRVGGMAHAQASEAAIAQLRDVGIEDAPRRMRQYPHQLSGGLLQRVMIAAALLARPRLLLADEPSTALDVTTQEEVMAILDEQRRERGLAMIFVSHDLDLAAAVTERISVMYAGTIVENAPSENLHEAALHPYTVALLAARPRTTRVKRLAVIPGRPVAAYEAGPGCVFADRCSFVEEQCRTTRPTLRPIADHVVACHRVEELQQQNVYERAVKT